MQLLQGVSEGQGWLPLPLTNITSSMESWRWWGWCWW